MVSPSCVSLSQLANQPVNYTLASILREHLLECTRPQNKDNCYSFKIQRLSEIQGSLGKVTHTTKASNHLRIPFNISEESKNLHSDLKFQSFQKEMEAKGQQQ